MGWIIDSGASIPVTPNREWFQAFTDIESFNDIAVGNGANIKTVGRGTIQWYTDTGMLINIERVNFAPEMFRSVLSVSTLALSRFSVTFGGGLQCRIEGTRTFD